MGKKELQPENYTCGLIFSLNCYKMKTSVIILVLSIATLSCKTNKQNLSTSNSNNGLIKDCPEELISNQMPTLDKSKRNSKYYIYKGERKEINEFDSVWVSKHCKVKVTIVQ